MSESKNEAPSLSPQEKKEQPLRYFLNCVKDGNQEVGKDDVKEWLQQIAQSVILPLK